MHRYHSQIPRRNPVKLRIYTSAFATDNPDNFHNTIHKAYPFWIIFRKQASRLDLAFTHQGYTEFYSTFIIGTIPEKGDTNSKAGLLFELKCARTG